MGHVDEEVLDNYRNLVYLNRKMDTLTYRVNKLADELVAVLRMQTRVLESIDNRLDSSNSKLDTLMKITQEKFLQIIGDLDTITTDVAADYQELKDEIVKAQNAGFEVDDAVVAKADANIATLKALGASVENPVPAPVDPGTGDTGTVTGGGTGTGDGSVAQP